MAVQIIGVFIAKGRAYFVENAALAVAVGEISPKLAGVHVTEVYDGVIFWSYFAKPYYLVESAELIYLAHGFKTHSYIGVAVYLKVAFKCIRRKSHCFFTGDLSRASSVDNYGVRTETFGGEKGTADIINAL